MKSNTTISQLSLENILCWFSTPQIRHLCLEEAIAYTLYTLFSQESYGTELINSLNNSGSDRISDTVLYEAFQYLLEKKIVTVRPVLVAGRGRPRQVYSINPDCPNLEAAREIANCWAKYLKVD
jgi:Transcriptional regulator PadR-like family